MEKNKITYDVIKKSMAQQGYVFFEDTNFNINIFGIRTSGMEVGTFNDILGCAYKDDFGTPTVEVFDGTTDPGIYWKQNPLDTNGTATVVPGQYRRLWQFGLHNGKYEALIQTGNSIRVWRDPSRDPKTFHVDPLNSKVYEGYFGINMHHAYLNEGETNNNFLSSAGCSVFKDEKNFNRMMWLAKKSQSIQQNSSFTYTLFREDQIVL